MIDSTPWIELAAHAKQKLEEEQKFHDAHEKAGKKVHGRRIDRRPLWSATHRIAATLARKPPDLPGIYGRTEAWNWLLSYAQHATAEENQFEAVVQLARIWALPEAERKAELAARATLRENRAEARRQARVATLREEIRQLEAQAPRVEPMPENVVAFPGARAAG